MSVAIVPSPADLAAAKPQAPKLAPAPPPKITPAMERRFRQLLAWLAIDVRTCGFCTFEYARYILILEHGGECEQPGAGCARTDRRARTCRALVELLFATCPAVPKEPPPPRSRRP